MNDEPDDIDNDDELDFDETGFDDFKESEGNTLADLWQKSPAFKIGAVIAGLVLVFVIFSLLSGGPETPATSVLPGGPEVTASPGSEGSSPAYIEALVDENTNNFEKAVSSGGSAIPMPIETPSPVLSLANPSGEKKEDPLQRWRRLQEERLARERAAQKALEKQEAAVKPPPIMQPPSTVNGLVNSLTPEQRAQMNETIKAKSESMIQQMQAILDNKANVKISSITLNTPEYLEKLNQKELIAQQEAQAATAQARQSQQKTLLPAGEIAYAQLITEANSDVPGPVLAEIMSGPLRGSRVLGSFTVQKELLTLEFNSIVIDDVTYSIAATALDPATTLPGMATDVDRHYLSRVLLPAAAAFVEGAATAIAETGRTTITIQGETVSTSEEAASEEQEISSGIEEAGQELREILDEIADEKEVTVIIASGTPMGLLFTQPVTVPENASAP